MPSFVWDRDTEDAWNEPYEYGGQEQFHREATKILGLLKKQYSSKDMQLKRWICLHTSIWAVNRHVKT